MKNPADRLGVMVLCASGLVLAALATVGAVLDRSRPQLDTVSGCYVGKKPTAETVILVDLTDPTSTDTWSEVRDWFRQFQLPELRDGERVTLWTLSRSAEGALQRRFCRCRPKQDVNPLVGNASMAAALSDSVFDQPFARVLATLPSDKSAAATPLLESIREACTQPEFAARGVPRRLVVVSDLEQNSALLSVYRTSPNFEKLRRGSVLASVKPDLQGVQVDVLFMPQGRAAADLNTTLQDFWRSHLIACGASTVSIRRL